MYFTNTSNKNTHKETNANFISSVTENKKHEGTKRKQLIGLKGCQSEEGKGRNAKAQWLKWRENNLQRGWTPTERVSVTGGAAGTAEQEAAGQRAEAAVTSPLSAVLELLKTSNQEGLQNPGWGSELVIRNKWKSCIVLLRILSIFPVGMIFSKHSYWWGSQSS